MRSRRLEDLGDVVQRPVVVETRRLGPRVYETTIAPGYAPDPDGPEVALCVTVRTRRTAAAAHAQAVDFATRALTSTVRPQE